MCIEKCLIVKCTMSQLKWAGLVDRMDSPMKEDEYEERRAMLD